MKITSKKWAGRMMKLAHEVAGWSKDTSTKVGAVITTEDGAPISWGFNGMPMGIDDSVIERNIRPIKYKWFCHAERNAMDLAPGSVEGGIMFVTFSPCSSCAQSIIQRKIKTVVVDSNFVADKMPERWQEDMKVAIEMLTEAGVELLDALPTQSVDVDDML